MKKERILIFLLLVCTILTGYSQSKGNLKITILKGGFIFDDKFDSKKGSIVVEGDKIKDILYTDDFTKYPQATLVDISGKYVMPGLIDSHVHLATAPNPDREKNTKYMQDQLSKMIYAGITTVRDMTGNAIILADYKRASTLNQLPAPSIFYAAQFAGSGYFDVVRKYSKDKNDTPWEQTISEKTDIKIAVAEAKGAGATGIKIYSDLTPDLIVKIVKEAKLQGLQSWSHAAVFPAMPTDIAKARVNSVSHAFDIPYDFTVGKTDRSKRPAIEDKKLDQLLLLMKANNVILDATNYIGNNNKLYVGMVITKRAHELGVKVCTGTDWPYLYEKDNVVPLLKEIKILISDCGFTSKDALISATAIGAASIGLEDRGVIAMGKRADLYITNSDPSKQIENLKDGFMTIKSGIIYQEK
jgi:imidazolonepropionase-like amidohydrolase